MRSILKQIESIQLVCPKTRQPLVVKDVWLVTKDGKLRYPFVNGIPVLFSDNGKPAEYLNENKGEMQKEYLKSKPGHFKSFLVSVLNKDHRSTDSKKAFNKVICSQPADALCLSIGGGPAKPHPNLVNLNIGIFPNVDVVADAYDLPYANESVDAIYCEAVLEHLEFPERAVAEMQRVLRTGGEIFSSTPFLQWYHGYPNHFQNYTLTGHQRLFKRGGFSIISSGTSVGPTVALSILTVSYVKSFLPFGPLKSLAAWFVLIITVPLKLLDYLINKNQNAYLLASTTYVHAVKERK